MRASEGVVQNKLILSMSYVPYCTGEIRSCQGTSGRSPADFARGKRNVTHAFVSADKYSSLLACATKHLTGSASALKWVAEPPAHLGRKLTKRSCRLLMSFLSYPIS